PAEREEAVLEAPVPRHRRVGGCGILARHLVGRAPQLGDYVTGPPRVEGAGAGGLLRVALGGVLRQVADLARAVDASRGGQGLPRERLGERRLARAVAPHEADLVALVDAEGDARHELPRAHADLQIGDGEHSEVLRYGWVGWWPRGQPPSLGRFAQRCSPGHTAPVITGARGETLQRLAGQAK